MHEEQSVFPPTCLTVLREYLGQMGKVPRVYVHGDGMQFKEVQAVQVGSGPFMGDRASVQDHR